MKSYYCQISLKNQIVNSFTEKCMIVISFYPEIVVLIVLSKRCRVRLNLLRLHIDFTT